MLDQIGEAYIAAVYAVNSKNEPIFDHGSDQIYQLPRGVPHINGKQHKDNAFLTKEKSWFKGYIENIHLEKNGNIHLDPNNAERWFSDEWEDHVTYDYKNKHIPPPR